MPFCRFSSDDQFVKICTDFIELILFDERGNSPWKVGDTVSNVKWGTFIDRVHPPPRKPYKVFLLPTKESDGKRSVSQAICNTWLARLCSLILRDFVHTTKCSWKAS